MRKLNNFNQFNSKSKFGGERQSLSKILFKKNTTLHTNMKEKHIECKIVGKNQERINFIKGSDDRFRKGCNDSFVNNHSVAHSEKRKR